VEQLNNPKEFRMKKLIKNKKIVIGIIIVLLILIVGVCFVLFNNKNNETKEGKVLKNETFTAYLKINPLVKLTFDASYYECTTKDGKTSICGKYKSEVTKVELLNDDAKNIYKDIDFKGKSIDSSITNLIVTAYDKGYDIKNITLTTNWNYKKDELKTKITDKVKKDTKVDVTINYNYQKNIDEASIEDESTETYNVNFDSDGGSVVNTETVTENNVVTKPTDPTKDGYTFVEWQLDGKTYDFNTKVNKDITLKAVWKKNESTNTSTNNTSNNTSNTSSSSSTGSTQCVAKKFNNKYTYVYESYEACKKGGAGAVMDLADKGIDVTTYSCREIYDDCGTKWYGVVFDKWSDELDKNVEYYY
jgi:uncharacterized repeat protein (TIGR02543 family)